MNKKKFEAYLLKVINKFIPILLLQNHTFRIEYGVGDKKAYFECLFNYPYLDVTIVYSESIYKKWKRGENITPLIVHEMCHPITDPFYSKSVQRYVSKNEIHDERETLTDHICNIALRINKGKLHK